MKKVLIFGSFAENPSTLHSRRSYFERLTQALYSKNAAVTVCDASRIFQPMRLLLGSQHVYFSADPYDYAHLDCESVVKNEVVEKYAQVFFDYFTIGYQEREAVAFRSACYNLFYRCRCLLQPPPDLAIYWNSFTPLHRWLRYFCREKGIPTLSVEGLSLPRMLEFDPEGSLGLTWAVRHNDEFNRLPVLPEALYKVQNYLQPRTVLETVNKHKQFQDKNNKIKSHLPCVFCGQTHTVVLKSLVFL